MSNPKPIPAAYIITCRTYGTWLHGDKRGSVDREHNVFLTPKIKSLPTLQQTMHSLCKEKAFVMNAPERKTVLHSIINTCQFAGWHLYAAHVRTNHMHVVVKSDEKPEKLAVSLKAYATRYLKKDHPDLRRKRFWSRGASTGYIFESVYIYRAIQYTVEEQGREMALYCDPSYYEMLK